LIGQPFTVKSAVAYGTLHFGPLVHQMNTSGAMFIETVRMLGEIKEKDRSVTLLSAPAAERGGRYFEVVFEKRAQLRGFKDDAELHRLRGFARLDSILERVGVSGEAETGAETEALSLFRADDDLVTVLAFLRSEHERLGRERTLRILETLKNERIRPASDAVIDALGDLLEVWQAAAANGSPEALFSLSSLTMLVASWLFTERQAERLAPKLAANLGIDDRRVVSNTIDAFTVLMPSRSDSAIERLLKESDNRVRANALVKQGLVKVDRAVLKGISRLLGHENPTYVASGVYALTEIVRNYRAIDPVFLAAHSELQVLIARAGELSSSENEMVRRQALRLEAELGTGPQAA
jgi:hypothetical protein